MEQRDQNQIDPNRVRPVGSVPAPLPASDRSRLGELGRVEIETHQPAWPQGRHPGCAEPTRRVDNAGAIGTPPRCETSLDEFGPNPVTNKGEIAAGLDRPSWSRGIT